MLKFFDELRSHIFVIAVSRQCERCEQQVERVDVRCHVFDEWLCELLYDQRGGLTPPLS